MEMSNPAAAHSQRRSGLPQFGDGGPTRSTSKSPPASRMRYFPFRSNPLHRRSGNSESPMSGLASSRPLARTSCSHFECALWLPLVEAF
jgi:hypothetical protein